MKPKEVKNKVDEYKEDYIDWRKRDEISRYCDKCIKSLKWYQRFLYTLFSEEYRFVKNLPGRIDSAVNTWNQEYVDRMLQEHAAFFGDIEGKALDEQQQRAVVTDECANLVVAGAGSGKTLTIAAKVKFLCEVKNSDPNDILLLSFTQKAAREMTDRIAERMGINAKASTFHALGLGIISEFEKKTPTIENNYERILLRYFSSVTNPDVCRSILKFIGLYNTCVDDDLSETERIKLNKSLGSSLRTFNSYVKPHLLQEEIKRLQKELKESDKEHWRAIQRQIQDLQEQRITIAGENVKSIEEVRIANFLFLNGINYEYEKHYPHDPKDNYRKKYRPDFYLPDYDIYWEHFGIDEHGNVPWLSKIEERKYIESIEWKRDLHKSHNTRLIETYSYMTRTDVFEDYLNAVLDENGIERKPIDVEKAYEILYSNKEIKEFAKLISTFIGLFKSQGYDVQQFAEFTDDAGSLRDRLFLEIAKNCFVFYQNELMKRETIDFNDMINTATRIVENGGTPKGWKYIIVDEYQDISVSRFRLLKALTEANNAKILCVGDDWQSIFRFTGSDIKIFTSFEEFWRKSEIMKIEQTYRNSQELIDVASEFIAKNPAQLKKELKSDKKCVKPFYIIPYQKTQYDEQDQNETMVTLGDALELSLDKIVELSGDKECTILLLGRHGFDKDLFLLPNKNWEEDGDPDPRFFANGEDKELILSVNHPTLSIRYSTIHKAKGLEADYTVIINLKDDKFGFPNQMIDDPVLRFVLSDMDEYQYAEERRLYYVAITRTKNATFLLEPLFYDSVFLRETILSAAKKGYCEKIIHDNLAKELIEAPRCPKCKTGKMIRRHGKYGQFAGCSNFPICDYTVSDASIIESVKICPSCGGFLVKRCNKYGECFYGCSNWPICKYTENE